MKHPWKKLSSRIVYKNRWIKVREDKVIRPDGNRGIYGVVDTKRSILVWALEGKDVYMVRQYRYAVRRYFLEVCSGGNSGHEKETPLQLAKCEMEEELGLKAKKWTLLGTYYPSNALLDEIAYVYLARDLIRAESHLDDDEFLEVKKVPLSKLDKMIKNGQIKDAYTIIAYYKLKEYLKLK